MLPVLIALVVFGGVVLAAEVGYRIGARRRKTEGERADLGVVQGAVLGLLGLLLGFSFAGAAGRFLDRQDLIVREANAIGTAYLRADLIDEPQRGSLRGMLSEYTRLRIEGGKAFSLEERAEHAQASEILHERLWETAIEGVRSKPEVVEVVIPAINDVIDLHTTRLAAARRHLPLPVMTLLMACAGLSLWMMGYSNGLSRRRNVGMMIPLAFVVASAIWFTIDLDYPRRGLIRLNDGPLMDLKFADEAKGR